MEELEYFYHYKSFKKINNNNVICKKIKKEISYEKNKKIYNFNVTSSN